MADRPEIEEARERWLEAFERAWNHVPLNLYDEDRKPAIYAFEEMIDLLGKQSEREKALESEIRDLVRRMPIQLDEQARQRLEAVLARREARAPLPEQSEEEA